MISDGIQRYLNVIGSDALAKGGSGDVLCGMILAFLAQGKAWTQPAGAAVYLHARCACTLSKKWASHSILPQDCLKQIPKELHELLEEKNEDEGLYKRNLIKSNKKRAHGSFLIVLTVQLE